MKILFISSDNNKTSGAFLCLVELNRYLREVYNVDTFVIIPKQGDGVQLLDKYHIPYKIIPSYSWITSSLQLLSRLLIAPSQCLQNLEQCA